MRRPSRRMESGLTLTEVTVVIVLAGVVMTGLIVFYLNSQALWLEGSAQAVTQRELTLALNTIAKRARGCASAVTGGDPHVNFQLDLRRLNMDPDSTFRVWVADSILHSGYPDAVDPARHDLGPVILSRVTVFAAHYDQYMVYVDSLGLLTPQGTPITMSTTIAFMNRGTP